MALKSQSITNLNSLGFVRTLWRFFMASGPFGTDLTWRPTSSASAHSERAICKWESPLGAGLAADTLRQIAKGGVLGSELDGHGIEYPFGARRAVAQKVAGLAQSDGRCSNDAASHADNTISPGMVMSGIGHGGRQQSVTPLLGKRVTMPP